MSRKSDILKLPDEVLAFVHQCLDDRDLTIIESVDLINELIREKYLDENEVTNSSLGRYAKSRRENFERQVAIMNQQKLQRQEFFERFGDEGLDNAGRYAAEMLYSFIMQLQTALIAVNNVFEDDEGEIDYGTLDVLSKVVQRISATIGNLEKSLSENKSRTDAIKKEAKAEALAEAADAMESQAKEMNQSEDVTVALRKAIMKGLKNG